MSVNRVSGESPEEPYPGVCSQLLVAGFEDVSPWRSWLNSPMFLSAPVEQPAASYCSSQKLTVLDLLAQILKPVTVVWAFSTATISVTHSPAVSDLSVYGCYSKSTETKLFSPGSQKDPSQTCLTNHTEPSCSLRARSLSLDGFGLSPRTPLAVAHTDECSLLLSFLDFNDQWLNFVLVKSSWLRYGNLSSS